MRNLRVILVTSRADHGGGPRHIELLLRHFSNGVDAHVACPRDIPYQERFGELTNGKVYPIPHRRIRLSSMLGLASYIRKNDIDIIHTHGKGAGIYGRLSALLTGRPCLHTPHGVHVAEYGEFTKWLYRLYENMSSFWVRHVIFVSEEERVMARHLGLWKRPSKSVIANGVEDVRADELACPRISARSTLDIPGDKLVVATISRFDFQKNMHEAYEIAKALPDVLFLWIGNGAHAEEIKILANSESVENLRFLGVIDSPISILAAADIYLSTSRWEGLPLAVLESMATGLPVVASDVTGHREIVGDHGGGFLYPLGKPDQAVISLRQLLGNAELRQRMGHKGQELQRRHYSARGMANAVTTLYRKIELKAAQ